jgi:hypothetical protein
LAESIHLKPMKKLLDHFRRKRPEASAPADESTPPAPGNPPKSVCPIATISVAPRTVRPACKAAAGAAPGQRPALQAAGTEQTETLTLTVGDFWDRLPADLLAADPPDRSTPLPFDLAAISERIGRGDPGIPLTEIARRVPQMFRPNAVIAPDRTIMFPWKAIHEIITQTRDGSGTRGLTPSGVETLSLKVRARRFRRPAKTAPAVSQPTPPTSRPEADPASKNLPAIPEKLSLAAPTPIPKSEPAAPPVFSAPLPAPATTPFVEQEHERQLAAIRAERDTAAAELSAVRAEVGALHTRATAAEDALSAIKLQLSGFEAQLAEAAKAADALKAERDAAISQAETLRAEHETAVARSEKPNSDPAAELIAERDAALARAAKAMSDAEAAMALAAEQTAEREASLARLKEVSAELDAAVARAAALDNDRERENSHAAQLGGQMAAAVSHAAECAGERDAAIARNAELSKERDAALARIAELEAAQSKARPTPSGEAQAPSEPQAVAEIEGCRNTMQALYAERDALRQEQQRLTARLVVAGGVVDKPLLEAAAANQQLPDTYTGLFPNRTTTSPLVIILLMVLLAYGFFTVSKTDLSQAIGNAAVPAAAQPAPARIPAAHEQPGGQLAQQDSAPVTVLEEVTVTPTEPPEAEAGVESASSPTEEENLPLD